MSSLVLCGCSECGQVVPSHEGGFMFSMRDGLYAGTWYCDRCMRR